MEYHHIEPLAGVGPLDPWSAQITRAVETASPYVAHVAAVNAKEGRAVVGSGFALDNFHVITHAPLTQAEDEITVAFSDGRKFQGTLVATDPLYFIGVLRLDGRLAIEPPAIEDSASLRPGQLCLALGDPFGLERTVTLGVISAADRTIYRPERFPVDGLIVTDAAVHPGNIGGPLVSLEGRIIGLNGMPWANNLSLAIQAEVVLRLANQILEFGQATHPWVGFSGQPEVIDPAMVSLLNLPVRGGVVVSQVAPGGPGERANVQPFDMVVRIDGQPVPHLGVIRKALARRRVGESGTLVVLRGSELTELEIPVEEIPHLAEA